MSQKHLYILAGTMFMLAGAVSFFAERPMQGAVFIPLGAVFLALSTRKAKPGGDA